MSAEPIYADPYTRIAWLRAERDRLAAELTEARAALEKIAYWEADEKTGYPPFDQWELREIALAAVSGRQQEQT